MLYLLIILEHVLGIRDIYIKFKHPSVSLKGQGTEEVF